MKIKTCGLKRIEDIEYANAYHPDYVGLVFAKSKRQVNDEQAKKYRLLLDENIPIVGVFVNDNISHIKKLVEQNIIQIIQLHGQENASYINELLELNRPIIKAIHVDEDISEYSNVDYYLIDSKQPGSGQRFDWSKIQKLDKPYFLAGGLSLENIDEAKRLNPYALDVSSGIETNGIKDEIKMKEMIRRTHND